MKIFTMRRRAQYRYCWQARAATPEVIDSYRAYPIATSVKGSRVDSFEPSIHGDGSNATRLRLKPCSERRIDQEQSDLGNEEQQRIPPQRSTSCRPRARY